MPAAARRWLPPGALAVLCAGLLIGAPLAAHEAHPAAPPARQLPAPGSYALPPLRAAPDGLVRDEQGKVRPLHELLAGRIVVLSFIYTRCADGAGCPMASYTLSQAAGRLAKSGELGSRVAFLSLSFDPAHDSPEVLAAYAGHFQKPGIDWRFMAADPPSMGQLLGAYRQDVVKGGDDASLAHTLRVFLIDAAGQIRNEYTAGFLDAGLLATDVQTLALETARKAETPPRPSPASTGTGDPRAGYQSGAYRSGSRALLARQGVPLALAARLAAGEPGLPAMPGPLPDAAQIALGRRLFFDRRLSHNNTLSCASCHVPEQGFTSNELATPIGIEGRSVRRNAPTLLNVGFLPRLFHDSRENRLEQQIWAPLLAFNEMGNPAIGYVLDKIAGLPEYATAFDGSPPTMETLGAALAAYQRSLIAGDSPFDRWRGGEETALPPAALRGYALFTGKAGCSGCHLAAPDGPLFTDQLWHNTGIGYRQSMIDRPAAEAAVTVGPGLSLPVSARDRAASSIEPVNDLGRYEVTGDPADRWRFRTPGLRNVALTAPYMHDGSLPDLAAVVAFYNAGGVPNEGLDARIRPLNLDATERAELLAFLESLTGGSVDALVKDAWAAPIGDHRAR